ncbi:MAG: hypothetical protein WCG84_02545 [Candidatus Moraniibacteriota bacterium]
MNTYPSIRLAVFVRHAEDSGENDLSNLGKQQAMALRNYVQEKIFGFEDILLENRPKVAFFTSSMGRAQRTLQPFFDFEDYTVLRLLARTTEGEQLNRNDASADSLIHQIFKIAEAQEAEYVVTVGHGDIPALLAFVTQRLIDPEVAAVAHYYGYVRHACGYIVNLQTGAVQEITVGADIAKKNEKPKQALLVEQKKSHLPSPEVHNKQEVVPAIISEDPYGNPADDDWDDDIPF